MPPAEPIPGLRRNPVQAIAVTGGKGGVGKSTLSVNLGVACAEAGRQTVLLDGDLGLANADVLLGITPRHTLADLVIGRRTVGEVLTPVRDGLSIVAGVSGVLPLADLGEAEHLGIVRAFSELTADVDLLLVDTAAGISPGVLQLTQAAQHVLVVVCDEPASVTDAYAVIKILSREHGLFSTLERVTSRFLDVVLEHSADVPDDALLRRAIREQRPVVEAFPGAPSSVAIKRLARDLAAWSAPEGRGNIGFFAERAVRPAPRLQVVR